MNEAMVSLHVATLTVKKELPNVSSYIHDYRKMHIILLIPAGVTRYNENVLPNPFIYNMAIQWREFTVEHLNYIACMGKSIVDLVNEITARFILTVSVSVSIGAPIDMQKLGI